jgi:hypothetical protein
MTVLAKVTSLDAAIPVMFYAGCQRRGASEFFR